MCIIKAYKGLERCCKDSRAGETQDAEKSSLLCIYACVFYLYIIHIHKHLSHQENVKFLLLSRAYQSSTHLAPIKTFINVINAIFIVVADTFAIRETPLASQCACIILQHSSMNSIVKKYHVPSYTILYTIKGT